MGFFDLFSQSPAPIEERMAQGVPQAPAVQPAPMVNPVQQPIPQPAPIQAQPGSTQAPPQTPNPEAVSRWTQLMQRIAQPDVLGPLQTFLAAASAPLQPGENLGARLGYAGTLMQLHRSMLKENARLAPQLEEERELKLQEMRGRIAQNEAATMRSRADTKTAELANKYNEASYDTRLEEAKEKLAAAKRAGNAEDIRLATERLKNQIEEKTGLLKANLGLQHTKQQIAESKSRERLNNRLPSETAAKQKWRSPAAAAAQLKLYAESWANERAWNPETPAFWPWAKLTGIEDNVNSALEFYNNNRGPNDPPIILQTESALRGQPAGKVQRKSWVLGPDGVLRERK